MTARAGASATAEAEAAVEGVGDGVVPPSTAEVEAAVDGVVGTRLSGGARVQRW